MHGNIGNKHNKRPLSKSESITGRIYKHEKALIRKEAQKLGVSEIDYLLIKSGIREK